MFTSHEPSSHRLYSRGCMSTLLSRDKRPDLFMSRSLNCRATERENGSLITVKHFENTYIFFFFCGVDKRLCTLFCLFNDLGDVPAGLWAGTRTMVVGWGCLVRGGGGSHPAPEVTPADRIISNSFITHSHDVDAPSDAETEWPLIEDKMAGQETRR